MSASLGYDPREFKALTFHDATAAFSDGADTPRAYLERCLETVAAREGVVRAFAARNDDGARAAADASTARWKAGRALLAIPVAGGRSEKVGILEARESAVPEMPSVH